MATSAKQAVPTGLESLDCIFRDRESGDTILSQGTGGLPRGEITEIYGPPGIGKTTFAYDDGSYLMNVTLLICAI